MNAKYIPILGGKVVEKLGKDKCIMITLITGLQEHDTYETAK
jgi:hypothetical protein